MPTLPNAKPLAAQRPDWFDDRACIDVPISTFFPEIYDHAGPAKRICGRCPVHDLCLQYALDNGERYGVFGGMTANQRDRLRWPRTRRGNA